MSQRFPFAVALACFEQCIRHIDAMTIFPYSTPRPLMPGNTFIRGGMALAVVSGLYFIGRKRIILPGLSYILSKDALAVYFVHLLLVYGVASRPMMFPSYVHGMSPFQVWCWIAGLVAAMSVMAYGIGWLRDHNPVLLTNLRHAVILAGIVSFVLWPELSVVRIGVSALVAMSVVYFFYRTRLVVVRDRRPPIRFK